MLLCGTKHDAPFPGPYVIQEDLVLAAHTGAGKVPLTLTHNLPSVSSSVPMISTDFLSSIGGDFLVKSFQKGSQDLAGAGSGSGGGAV